MNATVLERLQWSLLLEELTKYSQTVEGQQICAGWQPNLSLEQIQSRWTNIEPLQRLIISGYRPPIGEIPPLHQTFRGAKLGQTLDGESLWDILSLLDSVEHFHRFANDFQNKCPELLIHRNATYSLPKLAEALRRAIDADGQLLDSASVELQKIRRQKLSMRKTIENEIKQLLTSQELESYLQDKFFTLRAERYVVPMRLDGRGRVKGSIIDTSDSGQTLFIEPEKIRPLNEHLLELELSEKLEVLRIFRELSQHVASEIEILESNYRSMIELDVLVAQAALAAEQDAHRVEISESPCLDLIQARHPLVKSPQGSKAVANNIQLQSTQKILIVSGPNAGGKTVVLKTVGLLTLMAKAGLLIPADPDSKIYLFDKLYVELGDSQNLAASLSTFSGHLMGIKPIVEKTGPKDLVLLDEIAVGTEPVTGTAIGQAVLEHLADHDVTTIVTTHYDGLKSLAVADTRYRNASMEFLEHNLKPSYRLIIDLPGQSYGIELAEQIGLPSNIVERAKSIRGQSSSQVDRLIEDLQKQLSQARKEHEEYEKLKLETQAQKHRWEVERKELQSARSQQAKKIHSRYQEEIDELRTQFNRSLEELKQAVKDQKKHSPDSSKVSLSSLQKQGEQDLSQLEESIDKLSKDFKAQSELPGEPVDIDQIEVGDRVYVVSLENEATVTKVNKTGTPTIEVAAGLIKLKSPTHDLRRINETSEASQKVATKKQRKSQDTQQKLHLVIPSPTNSLDLRGLDTDRALDRSWNFIDKAVMRGEQAIILIHGHGTDVLKKTIRTALAKDSPYPLDFRPGDQSEGGDGVTVVYLRT